MKKIFKIILGIVIGLFVLGIIGAIFGENDTSNKSAAELGRESQKAFETIAKEYAGKYENAKNDIQKSSLREERSKAMSALDVEFEHWQGTVENIRVSSDKNKVWVTVKLNDILKLVPQDRSAIVKESPLYNVVAGLGKGDKIIFSGSFYFSDKDDYFEENSITESGSMRKPEFVIRFSGIKLAGSKEPMVVLDKAYKDAVTENYEKIISAIKASKDLNMKLFDMYAGLRNGEVEQSVVYNEAVKTKDEQFNLLVTLDEKIRNKGSESGVMLFLSSGLVFAGSMADYVESQNEKAFQEAQNAYDFAKQYEIKAYSGAEEYLHEMGLSDSDVISIIFKEDPFPDGIKINR